MRIKYSSIILITATVISLTSLSYASEKSQYMGQEHRQIKSLSASDINSLSNGKGWGLAKSAELNGIPGPSHLLELQDEIPLRPKQIKEINVLYTNMKNLAIPAGLTLIELERDLEIAFQTQNIDEQSLLSKLSNISDITRDLRYIHLSTHLATPSILDKEQIIRYNSLRGYTNVANTDKNSNKGRSHNHLH